MQPTHTSHARSAEYLDPLLWLLAAIVSGLTFVRWWQPTEGTVQGDTLGIVLGWCIVLALLGWIGLRGTRWRLQCDGLLWSVGLLAGGHILSGCLVLATSGDKRAAFNLTWEWLGLAVSFPLLRLILASSAARREWTVIAIGAVVTLSAYGLFQRVYVYPQTIADYQKVRGELDEAERKAHENLAAGQSYQVQTQIQNLQAKLIRQGVQPHMLSGSSRIMFEGRLLHSTEVLGRFALANTFAGLLLVWWIILLVQTLAQIRSGIRSSEPDSNRSVFNLAHRFPQFSRILGFTFLVSSVVLVGYCLLLTKSRTAYFGSLVGLSTWSILAVLKSRPEGRRILLWILSVLAAIVLLVVIALTTGGLDRFVLAEAPKSLQYRLEYWWSSLQVIQEAPFWGIGPGQFRQHYLVHKLPQSSEEIADPHNLILDVWANGGLLALVGLGWLALEILRSVSCVGHSAVRVREESAPEKSDSSGSIPPNAISQQEIAIATSVRDSVPSAGPFKKIKNLTIPHFNDSRRSGIGIPELSTSLPGGWRSPIRIGALASLIVVWAIGGMVDTTLWLLVGGWAVSIALLDRSLPRLGPQGELFVAASCGLLVHLLGAGGIAMPAITQLLVVLAIFSRAAVFESESGLQVVSAGSDLDRNSIAEDTLKQQVGGLTKPRRLQKWFDPGWIGSGATAVIGLVLFGACFVTAAQPVWLCQAALEQADFTNSLQKRDQYVRKATTLDPLSPDPWEKLARLAYQKWKSAADPDDRDFETAVQAQRQAIALNPLGFQGYRSLGEFFVERVRRKGSPQDKQAAIAAFQTALRQYPHQAELAAIAAEGFMVVGEPKLMADAARQALDQDDINHLAQHADKWLTAETRLRIKELLAKSPVQE